jgi:hypothetical protein
VDSEAAGLIVVQGPPPCSTTSRCTYLTGPATQPKQQQEHPQQIPQLCIQADLAIRRGLPPRFDSQATAGGGGGGGGGGAQFGTLPQYDSSESKNWNQSYCYWISWACLAATPGSVGKHLDVSRSEMGARVICRGEGPGPLPSRAWIELNHADVSEHRVPPQGGAGLGEPCAVEPSLSPLKVCQSL